MKDITALTIRQLRKVAKILAIKKVEKSTAIWAMNEIIDQAKIACDGNDFMIMENDVSSYKATFIHDYFEKGIAKCKTCGREDTVLNMRGDVCDNCI